MNRVFLLFLIGVYTIFTVRSTEDLQINELDETPRDKPPKLLWDPDKRMWTSDDEDFYGKDYSGEYNETIDNEFSFLDNSDNQTDIIEVDAEDQQVSNFECGDCNISTPIKLTIPNPELTTILPSVVEVNLGDKTSADNLIKYEEKVSSNIDNPLNQALDLKIKYKDGHDPQTIDGKGDQDIAVEVNPATEYPLWALEFESKRTRPLLKESITTNKSLLDKVTGITKLEVIPLEDTDSNNTSGHLQPKNESEIINIKLAPKNALNVIESTSEERNKSTSKDEGFGIGVGLPEYKNTEQSINGTKQLNATIDKTNPHNINSVYTTTIEPPVESMPEVDIPEIPVLINDSTTGNHQIAKETTTNNSAHTISNGNGGIPNITGNNNQSVSSNSNESAASSASNPVKLNDSNTNLIPVLRASCLPDITTHTGTTLHWPETLFNVTIPPLELCFTEDGMPVTRTCLNGTWQPVIESCSNIYIPIRTQLLNELLNSENKNLTNITKNLMEITSNSTNVTSYQIHMISNLLKQIVNVPETNDVKHIANVVSNIMHYEPRTLKISQSTLNSTDKILYTLDNCLVKSNLDDIGYKSFITDKILIQEANLNKSNFSGFQLTRSSKDKSFQADDISTFTQDIDIKTVTQNIDLLLLISEELKKTIKQCSGSQGNPRIISTVFFDDSLFNSNENQGRSEGKIISVLLPGFNCSFSAPLQVIFKPPNTSNVYERKCAYWQYGSNEYTGNIKGHWVIEGKPKPFQNTSYELCEFSHVTHFSLLVLGDLAVDISEADKRALDIITAIGSGLSLLGLFAVFLTAIAFKSYRSANAVVIHFSIAMAAQILLLFIADHAGEDKLMCTIFGGALHYVVLSQFCWMLTIALLQYKRYVLVFSNPTKYLMTKACAFAWGVPLLPIIVILSITTDGYGRNMYGLCYAIGNYFIFGVLIPVAIIVFINLLVFLRIMFYIASRKIKAHRKMDNATSLQLRLAIMLYFLLGLTWGFGLIAAIGGGVVYSYCFCITATLQGFVLFLFFIALSEKTRALWGSTLWCPCLEKKKKYDVNTDSSSHPMVRRPTSTNTSDTFTEGTGNDVFQKYKNRSSMDF